MNYSSKQRNSITRNGVRVLVCVYNIELYITAAPNDTTVPQTE